MIGVWIRRKEAGKVSGRKLIGIPSSCSPGQLDYVADRQGILHNSDMPAAAVPE